MQFESKKDKLFSILFYGMFAVLLGVLVYIISDVKSEVKWVAILIISATLVFLIWVWYGTVYTIKNNVLNIVSGPFIKNIPVRLIKKIVIGKTMWVGYKLGLAKRGVIITYNTYDDIYISPLNVDKFCEALKSIHSDIVIEKNIV